MDFSFNVNKLLREEITTVDSRLQPCRQTGVDRHGFQQLQRMLYEVVDKMGDASAKAQGLHGSITTGKKLEHANHNLYIMKDADGNGSQGSVVGILKVGHKKLFVYDHLKVQHELEPLCVLDFYVHESRQRMGCGRRLFDFMLSRERMSVEQLAIDRPSPKFLSFLKKHYRLQGGIPQVNNFVIFDGFFNNRNDMGRRPGGRNMTPVSFNNGRATPTRPVSDSGPGIPKHYIDYNSQNVLHRNMQQQQRQGNERSWTPRKARQSPSHMVAGDMMYSRHRATPPSSGKATPPSGLCTNSTTTPTRNFNLNHNQHHQYYPDLQQTYTSHHHPQQQVSHQPPPILVSGKYDINTSNNTTTNIDNSSAAFYKQLNSHSSPSTYYNMGNLPQTYKRGNNILEHLPPKPTPAQILRQTGNLPASTPNFGSRGGLGPGDRDNLPPTHPTAPNPPGLASNPGYHSAGVSMANAVDTRLVPFSNQQQENVVNRPPSGKQTNPNFIKGNSSQPPLLQRNGPPNTYKNMFNMHQTYQGRNGHLNVPNGSTAPALPGSSPYTSAYSRSEAQNTSWTVSGVLREQRLNAPLSNRYYSSSRLW